MRRSASAFAVFAAASFSASVVSAAPVFIQGYESGLVEPFNLEASFSGSSVGIVTAPVDPHTINLITTDGARGTAQSAEFNVVDDPAAPGATTGAQWTIRFDSNNSASASAANPLFNAAGYVGYYLKVAPTVVPDILTAPVLEGPGGTSQATVAVRVPVIKDGAWHLYQWNMSDPAQWNGTFDTAYGPAGLGNTTLEPTNSFDSIAFIATTPGDALIRLDQVGYDNAGPLPEPAAAVPLTAATLGLLARHRRRPTRP
jgi:hypothetical protein